METSAHLQSGCAGPPTAGVRIPSPTCVPVMHVLLSIFSGVTVLLLDKKFEFWKFKPVKNAVFVFWVKHNTFSGVCVCVCFLSLLAHNLALRQFQERGSQMCPGHQLLLAMGHAQECHRIPTTSDCCCGQRCWLSLGPLSSWCLEQMAPSPTSASSQQGQAVHSRPALHRLISRYKTAKMGQWL